MSPKISIFTLVGQVVLRVLTEDSVLQAELDPAEAYVLGSQLLQAARESSRLEGRAPPDYLRTDAPPLLSGE